MRLVQGASELLERTITSDDFERALRKFRSDAAAEVLRQSIRNLETKFDPDQPRAPLGRADGGQWIATGRGGGKRLKPAKLGARPKARGIARAAGFLLSHPEVAPIAAAVALPAVVGGVALSRTIGEFDHLTTGREKTPFLKLPAAELDLAITAGSSGKRDRPFKRGASYPIGPRKTKKEKAKECDSMEEEDLATCKTYGSMYGRSPKDNRRIKSICYSTMNKRQVQCREGNGRESVTINLYDGRGSGR